MSDALARLTELWVPETLHTSCDSADTRGAVHGGGHAVERCSSRSSCAGEWTQRSGLAEAAVWPVGVVKSVRGAVPVFRPARFPGPLPEPAVRLSPQRALRKSQVGLAGDYAVAGQGVGMAAPR